jgi:predicted dehydrogenase
VSNSTRRTFAAAIAAGSAASAWSSQSIAGANDRVRVGIIGCGGRGRGLWRTFLSKKVVEPVAACDVYEPFLNRAVQATQGKATPFRDFRRLLDRKDIEVVIVASPDHWHALQTVMACRSGKDVYVEKPLCLMPIEGRAMVNAARRYSRVVQVGSQQRSGPITLTRFN